MLRITSVILIAITLSFSASSFSFPSDAGGASAETTQTQHNDSQVQPRDFFIQPPELRDKSLFDDLIDDAMVLTTRASLGFGANQVGFSSPCSALIH